MTLRKKLLPKEVIAHWPEVFEEVTLNVLPLHYVHSVVINFKDLKSWEIKLTSQLKKDGWDNFQQTLSELLLSYEDHIYDIDFKLDANHVKRDIEKSTNKFLKKIKL